MKFVLAPDSFKGTLSAKEVADIWEEGIRKADTSINIVKMPVADGGEGTVEAMVESTDGRIIKKTVKGPLMEDVEAFYGILGDNKTAVIEMAASSGLPLLPPERRNPLFTTTYGFGELVLSAIDNGCTRIIAGIGGSATNDGGAGMAQAFGIKFYDKQGNILGSGGQILSKIVEIDTSEIDSRIKDIEIIVACDVSNPLCGSTGAAEVYARQKGATEDMVKILDDGLKNFAEIVKRDLDILIANVPGSGAAGGLGGGLIAFTGAKMRAGIDLVLEICKFEDIVKDANLVITGEGKTDEQTVHGKVPVGIAASAKKYDVPVVCISGGLTGNYEDIYDHGIDAAFSTPSSAMRLDEVIENSKQLLIERSYAITRFYKAVSRK